MHRPTFVIFLLPATLAAAYCFVNNDWSSVTPGEPFLLIWNSGSFWDVLLNSNVHSEASLAGVIARNISENSVVWVPPVDIAKGEPNKVFAVQLWDLAKGTSCISPAFRFVDVDNSATAATLPPSPFITTSTSLLNYGPITVTATLATFNPDSSPTYPTTTTAATESATPEPDVKASKNVTAIAVGAVFGVLLVILATLSVLLWRAKRKRAWRRGTLLPGEEPKSAAFETDRPSTGTTSTFELDSHSCAAAEMEAAAVPSKAAAEMGSDGARFELPAANESHELPSQETAPVELPAELPPSLCRLAQPGSPVSTLTCNSKRSSLDRYVVSPLMKPKS